jgi:hypothetical protein
VFAVACIGTAERNETLQDAMSYSRITRECIED